MKERWMTAAATFGAATLVFGAAALAQTPSPSPTRTPGVANTVTATRAITGTTATVTTVLTQPTVAIPTIVVSSNVYQPGGTGNFAYAHPAFQRVWDRTDHPVQMGQVRRTWFWGPGPNTPGLTEPYREGPGGTMLVQYFDKSRMEVTRPERSQNDPFFVTNGLLTVDMISGSIQVGDEDFAPFHPACIPMSGDFGDTLAPTYFAFQKVSVGADRRDAHPANNRTGQRVTETIDRNGNTGTDATKGNDRNAELVQFVGETRHNIPRAFWDFLNSRGPVHNNEHQLVNDQLIQPWFFASGLPISEPFWARARIRGQVRDVMIQAFERRALTYVPSNDPTFQVEMANIGQHYFDWRYRNFGLCPGQPGVTPTPPVPAPTITAVIGTPARTATPAPTNTVCPNCPTATATATIIVPPGTIVNATPPTATRTTTATRTATPGPADR